MIDWLSFCIKVSADHKSLITCNQENLMTMPCKKYAIIILTKAEIINLWLLKLCNVVFVWLGINAKKFNCTSFCTFLSCRGICALLMYSFLSPLYQGLVPKTSLINVYIRWSSFSFYSYCLKMIKWMFFTYHDDL